MGSKGFFSKLKDGLDKTRKNITERIDDIINYYTEIDDDFFEELEEVLITADVGVETTMEIIEYIKAKVKKEKIGNPDKIRGLLKQKIEDILNKNQDAFDIESPCVFLVVGVNGVGKTTTIGKLASRYKADGKKVLIAAGDTFRAAAAEQLEIWGERAQVPVVRHDEGSDPGAVVFDAVQSSKSRNVDLLICDTAGRLHNKKNLMNELEKINRILDREFPEAQKEVLLVLDATTGQNAISQAKMFKEVVGISGIILTKLDGTAKGGVVVAIKSELGVPIRFIGVGEQVEDLQIFDSHSFVDALFE
ncbi:MAG: Signal recognition particle receptor FtsY [Xylanivirga thermophila]|jgi:fused signal recognition particle receptor|uniref:signal recognition particle-docking protein FtsY n=1 Tax=Xylanivirga thermophila TaxID=2496273 RepID=UPI00101B93E8